MTTPETSPDGPQTPVIIHHVPDAYNRYPGECVTLHTRLEVREPVSDLTLRISLPAGLTVTNYQPPADQTGQVPYIETSGQASYVVWSLEGESPAGSRYDYQTEVEIAPTDFDLNFESRAVVTNTGAELLAQANSGVMVWAKGSYLQHLPAIFEKDDLMGRFLMLFESFWMPLDRQIDNLHFYFDPRLTPASFLPWLASWLDLELDQRWPEERLRQLIRWAIALHRSRGTKWGLLKYLEIYTGQKAKVIEAISNNFILGSEAQLGPGIALGRGNQPHTFIVSLRLPDLDLEDEADRSREEKLRRRTIESIIEMQKPAHTVYTLNLEVVPYEALEFQPEADADSEPDEHSAAERDEIAVQAATWFKLEDE